MRERNHSNVTFVTTDVLKRVTWKHMLHLFMKERSHLNVTFETKLLWQFIMEISPSYVWFVRKYLQQRNLEFLRKDKTYYAVIHAGKKPFSFEVSEDEFSKKSLSKTYRNGLWSSKSVTTAVIKKEETWIDMLYLFMRERNQLTWGLVSWQATWSGTEYHVRSCPDSTHGRHQKCP